MKLVVLTNILTPYRIPLFAAIGARVESLDVLLMARREENRDWELAAAPFRHEVLPGWHVKPRGSEVSMHINRGTIRRLRQLDPDLVLSGGFAPANVAAWVYCRLGARPFLGWGELCRQDLPRTSRPRQLLRRVMTTWSAGSIASSGEARDVFELYGARAASVLTVSMPIDVDDFHSRAAAARASGWVESERARYSAPILLTVGRLAERKGYSELLAMYAHILVHRPEASLLIVGDGPMRTALEARVQAAGWSRVHFLGFRQADEVARLLALADVFVFPSLYDPFGAVLSEAMAAGVPVVASIHAAATFDLVQDGITGFRIDPKDPQASAGVILGALSLPQERREELVTAAHARVKRSDIGVTADAMVAFMRGVVAGRSTGSRARTAGSAASQS